MPFPFVEHQGRRYTIGLLGYYRCTVGRRGYLHRHVWEDAHGTIPDGYDIHHIDGDRLNNRLSNLEVLDKAEHTRLHAKTKG